MCSWVFPSVSSPVGCRSQPYSLQLHKLLCLCAMCSWVFPSFSSPVGSRSQPYSLQPHKLLCLSAPCVPGSSPLSLPLWIVGHSLPCDNAGRLPEGVADPIPLSSADLCDHWFLICCLLRVLVSYLLWPPDTENFAQTTVDESLELMGCCLSCSPCFRSIEEYWLYICVEYPQLGGFSHLSGAPNFLENQKSNSCFACSCPHIYICPPPPSPSHTLCVSRAS